MALDLVDTLTPTSNDRLEQAQALVRAYCGWHIAGYREDTLTLAGTGQRTLILPTLHLVEVLAVVQDGSPVDATSYQASDAGVLTHDGWWGNRTEVTVTFVHGYQVVPPEVTAVVQSVAQRMTDNPGTPLVRKTRGPFTDQYASPDSGPSTLLDAERVALSRYKIVDVS